jgi:hypothetical protein
VVDGRVRANSYAVQNGAFDAFADIGRQNIGRQIVAVVT